MKLAEDILATAQWTDMVNLFIYPLWHKACKTYEISQLKLLGQFIDYLGREQQI